jgi:hypothetical protein
VRIAGSRVPLRLCRIGRVGRHSAAKGAEDIGTSDDLSLSRRSTTEKMPRPRHRAPRPGSDPRGIKNLGRTGRHASPQHPSQAFQAFAVEFPQARKKPLLTC